MQEIYRRLLKRRVLMVELIVSAFISNVLALASSLYVMQVLNRYVSHGVDSTLVTLTSGVLIAVILEFGFRQLRHKLVQEINQKPNDEINIAVFTVLSRAKIFSLMQVPTAKRREIVGSVHDVENAYTPANINTILDVPFSLLFLIVLAMFHWLMAVVAVIFIAFVTIYTLTKSARIRDVTQDMKTCSAMSGAIVETANREFETIRSFNAGQKIREEWLDASDDLTDLREDIGVSQNLLQSVTQSSTAVMSVLVIAVGAMLVVRGHLDAGMLIAGNILATRALQPFSRFANLRTAFEKADAALSVLVEFFGLPLEAERGSAKKEYTGAVEFRDVAFFYPRSASPLFESLSYTFAPGSLNVVVGESGTGKTTLAKLLLGLMDPVRGQILVDGLDLRQVSPEWWRAQVVYFPQEPTFLNATIEDNLKTLDPDISNERLNEVINMAGLRAFLDESSDGLATHIVDNGRQLAVGIRRQLALARALTSDGRLVVFDEMFESLGTEGHNAVNTVLNRFLQEGRTVFLMSHRANPNDALNAIIDLNSKPKPRITQFSAAFNSDNVKRAVTEAAD